MSLVFKMPRFQTGVNEGLVYWGDDHLLPAPPVLGGVIRGWAWNYSTRSPVSVSLLVNGSVVAITSSAAPSKQIRRKNDFRKTDFNFSLMIPQCFWNSNKNLYSVQFSNTEITLPGGAFFATLNRNGEPVEVDRAEGSPTNRLILPWQTPSAAARLMAPAAGIAAAKRMVIEHDLEAAAAKLRDLHCASPGSKAVLQRLAKLYSALGCRNDALQAVRCLLALDPNNLAAIKRAARLFIEMGQTEELILMMKPVDSQIAAEILEEITDGFISQNRCLEAQASARCLLSLEPSRVGAMERTIATLIRLGRTGDLPTALAAVDQTLPGSPQIILGEAFRNYLAMRGRFPIDPSLFPETQYRDDYLHKDLFFNNSDYINDPVNDEKTTFNISKQFCTMEGTAIDVGCGDGKYTRYLQQEFAYVYCFDPDERRQAFPHNVDLRRASHFRCALGSETSEITMDNGTHGPRARTSIRTKCFRLDDFRLTKVAYIKLDVISDERKILSGAEQTIFRDHPLIVIRQNKFDFVNEQNHGGYEWLRARGYRQVASCRRGLDLVMSHAIIDT